MEQLFLWIDESGSPDVKKSGCNSVFSVGMLLRSQPVYGAIIAKAFDSLRNDPDAQGNKLDRKTFARGYFHASVDSKNAHSHICRAIRSLGPSIFKVVSYNLGATTRGRSGFLVSSRKFHRKMAQILASRVSSTRSRGIEIFIARHSKSFSGAKEVERQWEEDLRLTLLAFSAKYPQIPIFFPRIRISTKKPLDPGIQITDFLLWAALRSEQGTDPWMTRTGFEPSHSVKEQDGPFKSSEFILADGFEQLDPLVRPDLIRKPRDSYSDEEVTKLLCGAERAIRLFGNSLPDHARQHQDLVAATLHQLANAEINAEALQQMAETYIILVDTVPLYDPRSSEEVGFSIDTKKLLGIVRLGTETQWFGIASKWIVTRKMVFQDRPSALGIT